MNPAEARRLYRVFISAPLDVGRERGEVVRVLEEINNTSLPTIGIGFEAVLWERLPPLPAGHSIQEAIHSTLEHCEVFILILHRRYGSVAAGEAMSTTEQELNHFLGRLSKTKDIAILSYFKEIGHYEDPGPELEKVLKFQGVLRSKNIWYRTFKDTAEFRNQIRADLYTLLFRFLTAHVIAPPRQEPPPRVDALDIQKVAPSPIAFISYSRDDDAHVRWVYRLATELVEKGIDVLLDLWDLHPGDDVAEYMENCVAKSHRVLVVCTPNYVKKANEGTGGVGYEKTIITGEIVRNVGTNKFIPVLRASQGSQLLPRCLSSRLYIDFRNDREYTEGLLKLLRELHGFPEFQKPPIGRSPFP
jgi:hypothetical protein